MTRRSDPVSWATIAGLHLVGWGTIAATLGLSGDAAPHGITVGTALIAYLLGVRHAFDPDHIAAIDNTTRRFTSTGRPAHRVGLWFSLGHSTVVAFLCLLLVLGIDGLGADLADEGSALQTVTGVAGPVVSSVFLVLIAVVNLRSLRERRPASGGPVMLLLRRLHVTVDRPGRMYTVGLLFGLGFDTATEIGLLALAGSSAATTSTPWWVTLSLPIVFASGMSLFDTLQGAVAARAYSGAEQVQRRARGYRIVITIGSAIVAFVIAGAQLADLLLEWYPSSGPLLRPITGIDIGSLGVLLTIALVILWGVLAARRRRWRHDSPAAPPGGI
ncbi:HoxN/HupN/NixA family nickel/cobalt transporter [Rathayibacter sp. Leaf296]|uniref:HoxN/HupN/NixA family nickel/cobalt transporter n=1 Tax=Rathayibacter sp. Leaf296 TaxID=1736327 RepID=UPI00070317EF|nr:hypothetical protein [Rathayibacter sp. Leaf296]KQQ08248.1 hypothetical protein ASF46_13025 [Rathayibacter sp. Leaf296]